MCRKFLVWLVVEDGEGGGGREGGRSAEDVRSGKCGMWDLWLVSMVIGWVEDVQFVLLLLIGNSIHNFRIWRTKTTE